MCLSIQFTKFLDIIQQHLHAAGWATARLDGKMTADARKKALARWRTPNAAGGPPVIVVSTLAGGTGLNLTAGSRLFMMDLWWNAAIDEQVCVCA